MSCIESPGASSAVLEPARDDAVRSHAERSVSGQQRSNRIALHGDDSRTEREHWVHDFRNALGNTTIAASTIRWMLNQQCDEQLDALIRKIEAGCERCLRLLATMPP